MPVAVIGVHLYHYSAAPFIFDRSRVYPTVHPFKPSGLWVSAEKAGDEEDYRGWKDWCEGEGFALLRLAHRAEVVLTPAANVLVLSDEAALRAFHRDYLRQVTMLPQPLYEGVDGLDWQRVITRFDGLIIAPYIWSCRMDLLWYYGWDCSSGCIWNLAAVHEVRQVPAEARQAT